MYFMGETEDNIVDMDRNDEDPDTEIDDDVDDDDEEDDLIEEDDDETNDN